MERHPDIAAGRESIAKNLGTEEGGPSSCGGAEKEEAFVTMITSDDFAIGAEVMLHSLRQHSRKTRPRVVMVTSEVSDMKREALRAVADEIVEVQTRRAGV